MGRKKRPKGLTASAASVLYQVAGELTLMRDTLTTGQRQRLDQLLLNVLADPDRYSAKLISDLHAIAMEP